MKLTAIPYYLSSLPPLITQMNFWQFGPVLFNTQTVIRTPYHLQFYVSNLMDIWTLKELIVDQVYTKRNHVPKGAVVIDIGGSIGDFAILSEKHFGAKRVYLYESNPERIQLFEKNVVLNSSKAVKIHPKPATSLDGIFTENKLTHCDFLKIDCEGAEYPIFKATNAKTLSKIGYIAAEIHRFDDGMRKEYPILIERFKKNGFTVKIVDNPVHDTIQYLYAMNTSYSTPTLA